MVASKLVKEKGLLAICPSYGLFRHQKSRLDFETKVFPKIEAGPMALSTQRVNAVFADIIEQKSPAVKLTTALSIAGY